MAKGYLVLQNGAVFAGKMLGGPVTVNGEAVFNTSMNGYQEIITDPSYAGQILTFTYPSIGNYGCGDYGFESERPVLRGLVVKEIARHPDHSQSRWTISEFLEKYQVPCLTGVDTRALTRILRMHGTMGAVLTSSLDDRESLISTARRGKEWLNSNLVESVTRKDTSVYGNGNLKIVLLDFGVKQNIINALVARGCQVVVMPAATTASQVLEQNPHGLVLSNGPGDPEACTRMVEEIKELLPVLPTFGICLGHQLIALALGARTYKMKFGHRGGNHTVKDLRTGRCLISVQNHGYAVERDSLPADEVEVSFINLNDGTVEGLVHKTRPILSVQFHPEAAPGSRDSAYLFDEFIQILKHKHKIQDNALRGAI
jgi:carbamoyl-phosphate synthase small subunit